MVLDHAREFMMNFLVISAAVVIKLSLIPPLLHILHFDESVVDVGGSHDVFCFVIANVELF